MSEGRRERKVVSVLFADLVGFTSRAESLDPEDVEAILGPYHDPRARQPSWVEHRPRTMTAAGAKDGLDADLPAAIAFLQEAGASGDLAEAEALLATSHSA